MRVWKARGRVRGPRPNRQQCEAPGLEGIAQGLSL